MKSKKYDVPQLVYDALKCQADDYAMTVDDMLALLIANDAVRAGHKLDAKIEEWRVKMNKRRDAMDADRSKHSES